MWRGIPVQLVVFFCMRRRLAAPLNLQRQLGASLLRLRRAKGFTQEELASSAGLVCRHVQKLEAGEVNATLKTVAALAAALRVEPYELFLTTVDDRITHR